MATETMRDAADFPAGRDPDLRHAQTAEQDRRSLPDHRRPGRVVRRRPYVVLHWQQLCLSIGQVVRSTRGPVVLANQPSMILREQILHIVEVRANNRRNPRSLNRRKHLINLLRQTVRIPQARNPGHHLGDVRVRSICRRQSTSAWDRDCSI
jgi:hypothetical protein